MLPNLTADRLRLFGAVFSFIGKFFNIPMREKGFKSQEAKNAHTGEMNIIAETAIPLTSEE